MVNQREVTEEGLEKNFATNTLGNEKIKSSRSFLKHSDFDKKIQLHLIRVLN